MAKIDLNEVFDSPWSKSRDETIEPRLKFYINNHKGNDEEISNVKAHKLEGNNGHLLSYVRNGALEVHHVDKELNSGLVSDNERPNPRFYSTIIDHLKTHALDKGKIARVVSIHGSVLSRHYKAIVDKIASKNGHHVEHSIEHSLGKKIDAIKIYPKDFNHELKEALSNKGKTMTTLKELNQYIAEKEETNEGLKHTLIGSAALAAGVAGMLGKSGEAEYLANNKKKFGSEHPTVSQMVDYAAKKEVKDKNLK